MPFWAPQGEPARDSRQAVSYTHLDVYKRQVNEYRLAVQTNDNTQGAVNEARQWLQKPYKLPDSE